MKAIVRRWLRTVPMLTMVLTPAAISAKGLSLDDLRQVVTVGAPAIAPDGTRVVYVRSRIDFKNDRRDTELVLVDVKSGGARVLTHDRIGVNEPKWSPDGSAIAYLASPDRDKPTQLYVLPMNGGDSLQVTNATAGIEGYAWRPDGRAFAYVTADEPPKKSDAQKALDAIVITDEDYLTREPPMPNHLWMVDADGSHATRLNSGVWSVVSGDPAWSADGTRTYYQRQSDAIFAHFVDQTTYVHDLAANTDESLNYGIDENPLVSPGGKLIAVGIPRHGSLYLQTDASVRSLADGHELFTSRPVDRNVQDFRWLPHDAGLLVETADGVRDVAWIVGASGSPKKVDAGDVDITEADVAPDGAFAFVGLRRDAFPEIYYLAPNSATAKQLTHDNAWAANFELGKSEAFISPTDLGTPAVGVLTFPVGYVAGKQYPLALLIHGGPVGTAVWDLNGNTAYLRQLLAARGYLVFQPNYRGSDNLGDAFLQAIVGDVTSGPGRDNLAAVAALRATGMVDPARIFVSGWSGGGLQTSWLIGHASFWRAAVSGAAVDDWYEQAVLSDINENFAQTFFAGTTPFTPAGRAAYAAESPLTFVNGIRTPTLILSDTRDQRVPVSQSYVFYHALKERGVPVQFTAFPRAGHFPTDPVGVESVFRSWIGWFEKWR